MSEFSILGQTTMLLVIFQVKHFVADFPLQFEYMLRKTLPGWDFFAPLALHCAVHAGLTLLVILAIEPGLWWLAVVDFVTHFLMDRAKSGPQYLGRFNDNTRAAYWNCFGFDQMVHHLTGFYIIWELVNAANQ
jgi:hypothetical protein